MKCPKCGKEVKFLEKHNMYFCESCNNYYYAKALRRQLKQILLL